MQPNDATRIFEIHRPRLIAICYRMLGERAAAEDAVQDAWLRWADVDVDSIRNAEAWLTRVATRIAIDALRSAQRRREKYVGPWLPEPLVATASRPVEDDFILAQECGLALLWAMERLDANERAAFILREAFDADYAELGRILNKSEPACRQMVSRARKRVKSAVPRFDVAESLVSDLIERFLSAASRGDFEAAVKLLAPDSVALSDGGPNARAARRPLLGQQEIAHVTLAVQRIMLQKPSLRIERCHANSAPAILIRENGRAESLFTLLPDSRGRIRWMYTMRAPEKLRGVATQSS